MKRMKWLKIKTPKDGLHDLLKVIIYRGGVKGFFAQAAAKSFTSTQLLTMTEL